MHYISSGLTTNPAHEEKAQNESEFVIPKEEDFNQFVHSISNDPLLSSMRSHRSYEDEIILQDQVMPGLPMEQGEMLV